MFAYITYYIIILYYIVLYYIHIYISYKQHQNDTKIQNEKK